ncbi:hypothetical protein ACFTAO_09580 [Paenibacillus rhizoplanae]
MLLNVQHRLINRPPDTGVRAFAQLLQEGSDHLRAEPGENQARLMNLRETGIQIPAAQ